MTHSVCPICRRIADIENLLPERDVDRISCKYCGFFDLPAMLWSYFEQYSDRALMPYLSAHLRQNSEPRRPLFLDEKDWEKLARLHKETPVSQKLERLLKLAAHRTVHPGAKVDVWENDAPLVDAMNQAELVYLLDQLEESGYLEVSKTLTSIECSVRADGWDRLQDQSLTGTEGRCFVAMSFDPSLDDAWQEGIFPALKEDCGLDPVRIDMIHHNEKICDKLIAEIRLSQFLVADFTLHRAGVYFEAGFALGLGRPVI
jgi:hypothetical protein